ncbi:MAG TPA: hypothetical protein VJR30_07860, partial [Bradyrhizobium sp.]|nr:hypothetical protein [Bradyrhizobium sp.]
GGSDRRAITAADMAKLCGLPQEGGADTIHRWEVKGPTVPVVERLRILAMASDRYPILDKFNVFDRHDVDEKERPARRIPQQAARGSARAAGLKQASAASPRD